MKHPRFKPPEPRLRNREKRLQPGLLRIGIGMVLGRQNLHRVQAITEQSRVQTYLEAHRPHLLRAYDADFLANAIETVRSRFHKTMSN